MNRQKTFATYPFLFLLLMQGTTFSQGNKNDLAILMEDQRSVSFSYQPSLVWRKINVGGQERGYYTFSGAVFAELKKGDPLIPQFQFPLVVPSDEISLQIELVITERLSESNLAAFKGIEPEQEFGNRIIYQAFQSRSDESNINTELVSIGPIYTSRGLRIATITVRPVTRNTNDGELTGIKEIRFSIRSSAEFKTVGAYTSLLRDVFAPPDESKQHAFQFGKELNNALATGEWYRFDVTEEGIYKIDQAKLRESGIQSLNIDNIRVFGGDGNQLSDYDFVNYPKGPSEIPRYIRDANGNGLLDPEDAIFFYAKGPNGWRFERTRNSHYHYVNRFTNVNPYMLAILSTGGRLMDSTNSEDPSGATPLNSTTSFHFIEQERNNLIGSGREWVGEEFTVEKRTATYVSTHHGLDQSKPILYRAVFLSRSTTADSFRVFQNNLPIYSEWMAPTFTASIENNYAYRSPIAEFSGAGTLQDNRSILRIEYVPFNQGARGWLDWIEILYQRNLEAFADVLRFTSPFQNGKYQFTLRGFSSRDILVFDVTDHANVKFIAGATWDTADPTMNRFAISISGGLPKEFIAIGRNGAKQIPALKRIQNSALLQDLSGAEFIIISPSQFLSEADRLKQHRESSSTNRLSTKVVNVEHIFNEFSHGTADPNAIRNFLHFATNNWIQRPKYVLLFGSGHYDYRGISSSTPNHILTYQSEESIHQIYSYTSDDLYAILAPLTNKIAFPIGRIPARSITEAREAVTRVIEYESPTHFDSWRNRIVFVADDGLTTTADDQWIHTSQADQLASMQSLTPFEKQKIYIVEYPTVTNASGRRKPEANQEIIDAFNRGALIVNYVGHGNPEVWAHEQVFTRDGSLPRLQNRSRYPFLLAATCDFARFDDPFDQSAGERILFLPRGGAISTFTASRPVYSIDNWLLNTELYVHLTKRDAEGKRIRMGDAVWLTKQKYNSSNDIKYGLLGDPTLRLAAPHKLATVMKLNDTIASLGVSVPALGLLKFSGIMQQSNGTIDSSFTGRALVEMYDARRIVTIPLWGAYSYSTPGGLLYRGFISVTNGSFSGEFPIPKDVSYRDGSARLSLYAWNGTTDAAGFNERITIAGADTSTVVDTLGPSVRIFLQDRKFRSGDAVPPAPILIVELSDTSGINTSTAGIGHRLEALVKPEGTVIDLTNYYRSNLDTYKMGEIIYTMNGLREGRYTVRVKAWDVRNNSSMEEVDFVVSSAGEYDLLNVFNFPNPMTTRTDFTFQRTASEPVEISVKIYSIAGRLLRTIEHGISSDRFVRVPWDGKDQEGADIANGIYFYRLSVRSLDKQHTREALGKIAILK